MDVTSAAQRAPTNRLLAIYLVIAAPALLFAHRPSYGFALFALHLLLAAVTWGLPPFKASARWLDRRFPTTFQILADWYPILLIPLLYGELAILNTAIWNGHYFDAMIQSWDQALFGGQPSRELAIRFPNLVLSELLHGAYLSYYFIIIVPPLLLYATSRRRDQRSVVFVIMLAFVLHYVFFIYLPVQGPRYLFSPPDGAAGPVFDLTHRVLEAGSSQGAAFPSSHLGVAVAQTAEAFRVLPGLAPVLALLTAGLGLGAVYGGFHYATDMIGGLILGGLAVLSAPRIRLLLAPRPPRE
jgi:membrane-associated phospholipid phosphatase